MERKARWNEEFGCWQLPDDALDIGDLTLHSAEKSELNDMGVKHWVRRFVCAGLLFERTGTIRSSSGEFGGCEYITKMPDGSTKTVSIFAD